jgi:F0F1-type ATP synthase membrane subunit b/b'
MSDKREKILKQLEEEAKVWINEEYARRYKIAKETMEKQGKETEEHLKARGVSDPGMIARQTQMSISGARSELYKDVQFEADQWIIKELEKRLKEEE